MNSTPIASSLPTTGGKRKNLFKLIGAIAAVAIILVIVFGNTGLFKGSLTGFSGPELDKTSCESNGGKWVQNAASLPANFAMADVIAAEGDASSNATTPAEPASAPVSTPVSTPSAPTTGHCEYDGAKVTYAEEIVLAKLKAACNNISSAKWENDKCKLYGKSFENAESLTKGKADFDNLKAICTGNGKIFIEERGLCSVIIAGSAEHFDSADELNSKLFEAECKKASGTFADNKCSIDKVGAIDNIDDLKNIKLRVLCADAKEFSNDWTEKQADWKDGSCIFADETYKDYASLDTALKNMRFYKELVSVVWGAGRFVNNKFYNFNNPVIPVEFFYQICFKPAFEYVIASENRPADYKPFYYGGGSAGGWMDGRATRPTLAKCDFPILTNDEPVRNQASIRSYYLDWKDADYKQKFDAVTLYEDIKKQAANLLVFEKECLSFGGVIDNSPYKTACVLNNKRFTWTQYYGQTGLKAEGEKLKAAASQEASIKDLQAQLDAQKAAEEQAEKAAAEDKAWQDKLAKLQAEKDKTVQNLEAQIAAKEKEMNEKLSAEKAAAKERELQDLKQRLADTEKEKAAIAEKAAAAEKAAVSAASVSKQPIQIIQQPAASQSDEMALLKQQLAEQKAATDRALAELQDLKIQLLRAENKETIDALSKKIDEQVAVIQKLNQPQTAVAAQKTKSKKATALKKRSSAKKKTVKKKTVPKVTATISKETGTTKTKTAKPKPSKLTPEQKEQMLEIFSLWMESQQ